MVQIIEFAVLVIVISASGVMAPGPLFAANITYGLREGVKSGIKIAIGHSIVELPLVILLGVGVFSLEIFPEFRTIISIFGAITLFVFAGMQIKTIFTKNNLISTKPKHGPIITGILLSALKSIFYHMVVNNRIQINFRCHVSMGICGDTNCICITYLDGFCMARNCCISGIKKCQNNFKQKL